MATKSKWVRFFISALERMGDRLKITTRKGGILWVLLSDLGDISFQPGEWYEGKIDYEVGADGMIPREATLVSLG